MLLDSRVDIQFMSFAGQMWKCQPLFFQKAGDTQILEVQRCWKSNPEQLWKIIPNRVEVGIEVRGIRYWVFVLLQPSQPITSKASWYALRYTDLSVSFVGELFENTGIPSMLGGQSSLSQALANRKHARRSEVR